MPARVKGNRDGKRGADLSEPRPPQPASRASVACWKPTRPTHARPPAAGLTSCTNTEKRARICSVSLHRRCASDGRNSASAQQPCRLRQVACEARRQKELPAAERRAWGASAVEGRGLRSAGPRGQPSGRRHGDQVAVTWVAEPPHGSRTKHLVSTRESGWWPPASVNWFHRPCLARRPSLPSWYHSETRGRFQPGRRDTAPRAQGVSPTGLHVSHGDGRATALWAWPHAAGVAAGMTQHSTRRRGCQECRPTRQVCV